MFGYVKINKPELKIREYDRYKSYYCGLCRVLKQKYGMLGQMTLTYDFTFLILVLSALYEDSLYPGSCGEQVVRERCKTHPLRPVVKRCNEFTQYAAAMNILLAYYHMADDWKDERNRRAYVCKALICTHAAGAAKEYERQAAVIRRELKRLSRLEKEGCTHLDRLADCFGRIMGTLFVYRQDEFAGELEKIGYYLGKFIYLMDAYEDLPEDEKTGSFNPLKEISRTPGFDDFIRNALNLIMAECTQAFERLPILQDAEIIRNILYAGVWQKYNKILQENSGQGKGKKENDKQSI